MSESHTELELLTHPTKVINIPIEYIFYKNLISYISKAQTQQSAEYWVIRHQIPLARPQSRAGVGHSGLEVWLQVSVSQPKLRFGTKFSSCR